MDEVRRLAMRRAHTKHRHDCPCGRTQRGNGWRSHARACPDFLERYGYAFSDADAAALRHRAREIADGDQDWMPIYTSLCIEAAQRLGLLDANGKAKRKEP
jgi:hypothetical protein